jgi:hypothetical protein
MRITSLAATAVTTLGLLLTGVSSASAWHQPYGGCEEATLAPYSVGADQCRAHGWTIRTRLAVNPHAVVKGSGLPHCVNEDGSGQRSACSWNFHDGHPDGNGVGLSFWVDHKDHVHYVWPVRPIHGHWHWVGQELGDALAEGEQHEDDWGQCMFKWRHHHGMAQVMCPDGFGQTAP